MAWANAIGLNFRTSDPSGFTGDPTNTVQVHSANDIYPVSKTFGAVTTNVGVNVASGSDNSSAGGTLDGRLSGTYGDNGSGTFKVRVDLEAPGQYRIGLAVNGDPIYGYAGNGPAYVIKDNTTTKATITSPASSGAKWVDANETALTAADWVTSQIFRDITFASTTFWLELPVNGLVSHISIEQLGDGGGGTTRDRRIVKSFFGLT
jgi:hypothetical protein